VRLVVEPPCLSITTRRCEGNTFAYVNTLVVGFVENARSVEVHRCDGNGPRAVYGPSEPDRLASADPGPVDDAVLVGAVRVNPGTEKIAPALLAIGFVGRRTHGRPVGSDRRRLERSVSVWPVAGTPSGLRAIAMAGGRCHSSIIGRDPICLPDPEGRPAGRDASAARPTPKRPRRAAPRGSLCAPSATSCLAASVRRRASLRATLELCRDVAGRISELVGVWRRTTD
jgi:hypothetical protein